MNTINIPKWLEPAGEFDLKRLGRDRDGGYLVDSRDVDQTDCLISLGVNADWSFDEDFLELQSVPLHAYDGTIDRRILGLKFIKAMLTRGDVKSRFKAWRDYKKFFSGSRRHHPVMVGLQKTPGFVTLRDILSSNAPEGKVFLKIDIEGWEYRLLDDILAAAGRVSGLMIEFHDVDLHYAKLQAFVEMLPLRVAHVHYNSFAPVTDDGIPFVLEVTFSSHEPLGEKKINLPHALDRLSAPNHEQREIRFVS